MRRLHTPCLWVQKVYHERRATLLKIPGTEKPSDMGTKVLASKEIWKFLEFMGFEARTGRSALALRAAT